MDWLKRIENLPLIAVSLKPPADHECIDEVVNGVKVTVTHQYLPIEGAAYVIILSGPIEIREWLASQITERLGEVIELDTTDPGLWRYIYRSPCTELPVSTVRRTIGDEQIEAFCHEYEVTPTSRAIIDKMVALTGYFEIVPESERVFLHRFIDHLSPEETRQVMGVLIKVNLAYYQAVTGLPVPPL